MVKHSRIISSVVLFFFLSLILTAYSVRNPQVGKFGSVLFQTVTTPLQTGIHSSWSYVNRIWEGYIWLIGAEQENRRLRTEISLLKAEVIRLRELSQEATALREILQLRMQTGYKGVVTSVIGADPSGWVRSVTIDRGRDEGLQVTMPAVLGGAVVGQVHAVGPYSANVLLLTDRTSGVAALIQRTRARGIVLGTGTDECTLEYVREEEDVAVGDTVVTSGLDGVYPKGLEVGQVIEVRDRPGEMFKSIRVKPTVDLLHLETLFVLTEFANKNMGEMLSVGEGSGSESSDVEAEGGEE